MRFFVSAISAAVILTAVSLSPVDATTGYGPGPGRGGDVDFRVGLRFSGERGFVDGGFSGIAWKRVRQESAVLLEEPREGVFRQERLTLDAEAMTGGKPKEKKGLDWMVLDPRKFSFAALKEKLQTMPGKLQTMKSGKGRRPGRERSFATLNARKRYFSRLEDPLEAEAAALAAAVKNRRNPAPVVEPAQPEIPAPAKVAEEKNVPQVVAAAPVQISTAPAPVAPAAVESWPPPAGLDRPAAAPAPVNNDDDWVMVRTLCRLE